MFQIQGNRKTEKNIEQNINLDNQTKISNEKIMPPCLIRQSVIPSFYLALLLYWPRLSSPSKSPLLSCFKRNLKM